MKKQLFLIILCSMVTIGISAFDHNRQHKVCTRQVCKCSDPKVKALHYKRKANDAYQAAVWNDNPLLFIIPYQSNFHKSTDCDHCSLCSLSFASCYGSSNPSQSGSFKGEPVTNINALKRLVQANVLDLKAFQNRIGFKTKKDREIGWNMLERCKKLLARIKLEDKS